MPQQVKKSLVLSIYFTLAVSTLLVFWQISNFDFVTYDDNVYVYENPYVLNGLTADSVSWAFTAGHASNWHPLTWLSLMLDCQLFGADAGRMHVVNLLLHLVNTLLLFAVLKKMTSSFWPSAFVAAAFAIHPMHVESVAWIAERKDVLSTLFLLLTMLAYVRYVEKLKFKWYLAAIMLFILGLMTKPMLVTLPFVLLLLDYWPLNRLMPQTITSSGRQKRKSAPAENNPPALYRLIIEKVPFFILSVISSVVTFLVQRSGGAVTDIDILSWNDSIANAFLSYAEYMGKMVWPINLAVFYPFNAAGSIPFRHSAVCALLLLVISVFVVYIGRNQRYLLVGWFWFVGTLIPVIGIVPAGGQAYADRYTYVPYIGLFLMIAWGMPQLLSKLPHRKIALGISMVIVLTTLGICAHRQASFWNNSITLFSHALAVTQNNYIAHGSLAVAYGNLGRWHDEIEACRQAVRIKPNYAIAYNNLGIAYGKLDRLPEAIESYKQAVRIKPDFSQAHYNLGNAYSRLGRWYEAIESYKQAVRIKPDIAQAHCNLGYVYLAVGDKNSALAEYNILKSLNPPLADDLFKEINK